MAKQKIIHLPGHRHFVTFTTYKRRRFLNPELTRDIVPEVLQKCLLTHQTHCTAFVVMPDHVHAILFGNEKFNVSQFIQVWKKTSSYRIKRFYEREMTHYLDYCLNKDPIWQSGFYDLNLETDEKPTRSWITFTITQWLINSCPIQFHGNGVLQSITNKENLWV